MAKVGKTVKKLRVIRGYTQAMFADTTGISPGHLSLIEADKREPSMQLVERLAEALQVPQYLLFFLACEPEERDKISEDASRELQALAWRAVELGE